MKVGRAKTAKKSAYMKDENPELRKVARALHNFVKGIVPGVKETENAWGIPTFEAPNSFCFYQLGRKASAF
jgi:hypothetical protein